jgi:hypothetical protein
MAGGKYKVKVHFAEITRQEALRFMLQADFRRLCEYLGDHPDSGVQIGELPVYWWRLEHPPCRAWYQYGSPNDPNLLLLKVFPVPRSPLKNLVVGAKHVKLLWDIYKKLNE